MPVRRYADPIIVQHVWDAVRSSSQQRYMTDITRLGKYLQKVCDCSAFEVEQYIDKVVKDNLLVSIKKTTQKGNKTKVINECFKIPAFDNNTPVDDGYDWYCIECHLAGDVTPCKTCYRVFHLECASNIRPSILKHRSAEPPSKNENEQTSVDQNVSSSAKEEETILIEDNDNSPEIEKDICSVCRMLQEEETCLIDREELNYLLNFTLNRIRIWLPSNITDVMAPRVPHSWMTESETAWRVHQLLYQTMDVPVMEMKLRTKEYTKPAEFHADVISIQHNVAIFHGPQSQEVQGSELMLTDSRYDLVELQQCVDCYKHSNEKRNDFWFCIPCRPPHDLVWAKQKGYPYWPAKVIRKTVAGQYDVRFFGAKHLRAVVDKNYIKPIDFNIQNLQIKRTQAFKKALQELTEYQRLLQSPEEVAQIMMHTPELKLRFPLKNKQKLKRPNDSIASDTNDSSFNQSPVGSDKKKRGRKPGSLNKSTKATMHKFSPRKESLNISSESHVSADHYDHVSSSTENVMLLGQPTLSVEGNKVTARSRSASGSGGTQQLERAYSDPVEYLRRQLEQMSDKDSMIRLALETMQLEMDRLQNSHSEHIRSMVDSQNVQISEIKKKQWCYNCEQEAIYHCCWNTAYCSTLCQQQHWQSEHKKVCRRKR